MATTATIKKNIAKLEAALKSKATPKSLKPKLETQLVKSKAELSGMNKGTKPKNSSTKSTQTALQKLKAMVNKNKKYKTYKGAGVDLEKDADRPALRTGKRIAKESGKTYYEYRANRIDVKQPPKKYPKLEKGGYMAKGGKIENQYEGRTASDIWKNLDKFQRYEFLLDHEDVILGLKEAKELPQGFNGQQKRLDWSKLDKDVKKAFEQHTMWGEYAKGGYMAKGGQLEVGDMVMVDDSGYVKYFSGFDTNNPAKIISKDKGKSFGKVKYFYGLETADGKKPFNQAIESMLTKVSKDGGYMAKGGNVKVKVGDKVKTKTSLSEAEVYEVSMDGYEFKLKDRYGNKSNKIYYTSDFSNSQIKPMAKGGYMADGGKTAKFWDNLDFTTRAKVLQHLYIREDGDNAQIYEYYNSINKLSYSDWDKLPKNIKIAIEKHEGKLEQGGYMAKGGQTDDFYDNLQVHVQGVGTIYHGQSMKAAIKKADAYLLKNPKAEVVIVDEKYGDEYDLEGNQIENEDEYAKGGISDKEVAESNAEMVLSQIKAVKHHAQELSNVVSKNSDIEAWVVAKIERASTDLSDITHYLEFQTTKMAMGGEMHRTQQ